VAYQAQRLTFAVQDSGIGIPQSEQEKIFAMYYQVEDEQGGKPATGTGIGLAVSARIAEAMGGSISVESEPFQGACFTLDVSAPAVMNEAAETVDDDEWLLPALHILLVEDIELNVIVARSVLEKLGCSIDVAMTGQQALDLFEPDEFDMVLLDIQLPDMTGLDVAAQLRARFSHNQLPPLVALTANVLKNKSEYLEAGLDGVLSKPLSVPALTATIKQFWDPQSTSAPILPALSSSETSERIDTEMLQQYLSLVGPSLIYDGLAMFEKMMPDYLEVLDSNMLAKDQHEIAEQGHKIKGAAGAIGLKHLQRIAQQIQSPELPAWWDNVQDWVDELHSSWQKDIEIMKAWLEEEL